MVRRLGIRICVSLACLVTLFVLVLFALLLTAGNADVRSWALDQAKSQIAQHSPYRLSYESSRGNLLWKLDLKNVRLTHKGRLLFETEDLGVTYNAMALIFGRLSIGKLALKKPRVDFPPGLFEQAGGAGSPFPMGFSIKHLKLTEAAITAPGLLPGVSGVKDLNLAGWVKSGVFGLEAQAKSLSAQVIPQGGGAPVFIKLRADYRKQAFLLHLAELALGGNSARLKGRLNLSKEPTFEAEAKLQVDNARDLPFAWPLATEPAYPLTAGFTLNGGMKRIGFKGSISSNSQKAPVSGELDLKRAELKLSLGLDKFKPALWNLADWDVEANGTVEASLTNLWGEAPFKAGFTTSLDELVYERDLKGSLDARAVYEGGGLHLQNARVKGAWGEVEAKGGYHIDSGALEADFSYEALTVPQKYKNLLPEPLRGARLNGSLKAEGLWRALDINLLLERSVLQKGLKVDRLTLKARQNPDAWLIKELDAKAAWGDLTLTGRAGLAECDLSFAANVEDYDAVIPAFTAWGLEPPPLKLDDLVISGVVKGPFATPALRGEASLSGLKAFDRSLEQAEITFDLKSVNPSVRGVVKLNARNLWTDEVMVTSLKADAEFGVKGLFAKLAAQCLGWRAEAAVSLKSPLAKSRGLGLSGLTVTPPGQSPWLQQGTAMISWARGIEVESLSLGQKNQEITLSGTYEPQSGRVKALLRGVALKPQPWLDDPGLPKTARLDLSAELSGRVDAPEISLKGRVSGFKWKRLASLEMGFEGRYSDGRLTARGRAGSGRVDVLSLDASLPVRLSLIPADLVVDQQKELSFNLNSQGVPIKWFSTVTQDITKMDGVLRARLKARGTLEKPVVSGSLEIEQGRFAIPEADLLFGGLSLKLVLKGDRLNVAYCRISEPSTLDITGDMRVAWRDDPGEFNIKLNARDYTLKIAGLGQAVTDINLALTGSWFAPVIKGKAVPKKIWAHIGAAPPADLDDIVIMKPGQRPPPMERIEPSLAWNPPGFLGMCEMDILVDIGHKPRLEFKQGWVQLAGSLRLTKAPGRDLMWYEVVYVRRGSVNVVGKHFEILEAMADFAGRNEPNPLLNGRAEFKSAQAQIWVSVAGDAEDPYVQLSSQPPMTQTDILSSIIFGRPASDLSASQSNQLSAQAVALLGQRGAKSIQNMLGATLAPDVVTVHEEKMRGTSVEAGKYLSPDLYLRYRHNLDKQGGGNLGVEYRLRDWLSLESEWGSERNSGVDVTITKDF